MTSDKSYGDCTAEKFSESVSRLYLTTLLDQTTLNDIALCYKYCGGDMFRVVA